MSTSTSPSTSPRLFQPYPSHFPWSSTLSSLHRNIYLYKETRSEIIQRDKRIASREAAYKEFYARMAEESRVNHVGVTTRSAAAAAVSSIPGEQLKRPSRVVARTVDSAFNVLDDPKSPPRKKARTTARIANNNKLSTSNPATTQTARNNNVDFNSVKVPKPAPTNTTAHSSSNRLTTRSQTKLRRTARCSPTTLDEEPNVNENLLSEVDIDREAVPIIDNDTESRLSITQETIEVGAVPTSNQVDTITTSRSKYFTTEKASSPELSTPRTTLGRASSTSSTLASSRQSSDDGFRKPDQRFTDGRSTDGDVRIEPGDLEMSATAINASSDPSRKSDQLFPSLTRTDVFFSDEIYKEKESEVSDKRPFPSLSPQPHESTTATKKTGRDKSAQKRPPSFDDDEEEEEVEQNSPGQISPESLIVIPPEVRRSGRVSKKRKLE